MTRGLRLAIGDIVVYRSYGAGPVAARESRVIRGTRQEVVVLAFASGLTVELPLPRARELLRPLASESDLSRVQKALRTDQPHAGGTWLKRQRASLASLNEGDPVGLADIIRNSTRRHVANKPTGREPKQPLWEREIATKARSLLSTEIALVRDIKPEEASNWIDQQLNRRP